MIEHKIIAFGSDEHKQTIELRDLVLRKPLNMEFTQEQLAAEANQIHIGQFTNGKLTACLVMKPIDNDSVKMRQVAVNPTTQGKGHGSLLVNFVEQEMLKQGYKKIELHARETAVAFYKKLNYDIIGEPFDEIGIKHYKMVKQLF